MALIVAGGVATVVGIVVITLAASHKSAVLHNAKAYANGLSDAWASGMKSSDSNEEWSDGMELVPGEYVFDCHECDGDGQIEVGDRDYGDAEWVQCERCFGSGVLEVDEEEAAEIMTYVGSSPIRRP
ncbi:hypothetical protein [Cellulomonas sp. PSBB021]|uniref:hypothetical protein n=1 Tax=Cellulomonas sp. PSBB021 TaxID=2003551 RepID=UPI000B8D8AB4|nr:hypothetical protein [Cellulomonas sp. PSBB021]ASR56106.1 hypothetical protein CBP52_14490 [Cellulomonas sp. PSBB021]